MSTPEDKTATAADRYVQFMVLGADGVEKPLFPTSDGSVVLCSRDGDLPVRFAPLRLNLPPVIGMKYPKVRGQKLRDRS